MAESLDIANFGPIRKVHLRDIKALTVIIGSSGTGKSTIMKVLSLFRWLYKMEHVKAYLKLSGVKKLPFRLRFSSYIKESGLENYLRSDTEIIYERAGITLTYKNKKYTGPRSIGKQELHLEKVCFVCDSRIVIPELASESARVRGYYLRDTFDAFELAMEKLGSYSPSFFEGLSLSRLKGKSGRISYRLRSADYELDLREVSSGTQSSLPMMAIVSYYSQEFDPVKAFNEAIFRYLKDEDRLSDFRAVANVGDIKSKRVSIHIEEPELSLSPEKQRQMLNELIDLCFGKRETKEQYDMGIILTTHSPYIVNQLNLLIRMYDRRHQGISYEDLEVYKLDERGRLYSLKAHNERIVDTMPLSDDINAIYEEYDRLGEPYL